MADDGRLCKGMNRKLYRASRMGNTRLLDQVVKKGKVDVLQEVTPGGDTALHTATFYGHVGLVRKLIQLASHNPEAGTDFLKAENMAGNTALHVAAREGREKIVKMLVEKERGVASVKNKAGETALFKASQNGHVGIVECLLEYTPENDELDKTADGQTPLLVAVSRLHTGVTRTLLKKRPALVDKADHLQRTALHILALDPLINPAFGWKIITRSYKNWRIGKMILGKKISLMYRVDAYGQSALHLAAKVGNSSLVSTILIRGGDCAHITDNDGKTALHLAVENASQIYERTSGLHLLHTIKLLVSSNLVDCSDVKGQTALDIAIQKTKEDALLFLSIRKYLIRHGARHMFGTETREDSLLEGRRGFNMEIVSVVAALIATVAFQAAFTLPGDMDSVVFKLFLVFDSLAFCCSIGSAILIIYGSVSDTQDRKITDYCVRGVWVAFTCIGLAFGAAIHLVVARKCMWLAVVVWIMVGYIPFLVWFTLFHIKMLLFEEKFTLFLHLFLFMIGLIMNVVAAALKPLYFVCRYLILGALLDY